MPSPVFRETAGGSTSSSTPGSGETRIWKLAAAGGDAVQVSPGVGLLAIESVDGRSLFYVADSTNGHAQKAADDASAGRRRPR